MVITSNTAFSVLLSVYSKENPEYLYSALNSIWENQNLKPSEIVIIKDGPLTEELDKVIETLSKIAPIKCHSLDKNYGLGIALAKGLIVCSNEIVARMDSDDIASPDRFIKQLQYIKENPEITLLSSNIAEFEENISIIRSIRKVPQAHKEIIQFAKRRNPMNHMTVMFRKSAVLDAGNYLPFHGYEDYYLWVRMLQKGYKAANLKEHLVYARIGNNMIARRQGLRFFKEELRLQKEFFRMGFINRMEWAQNILLRAFPRLMPILVLKLIYKTLRK